MHYRRFMVMIAELASRRRRQGARHRRGARSGREPRNAFEHAGDRRRPTKPSDPSAARHPSTSKTSSTRPGLPSATYEISIEPHEDTCVLFAPENPSTQAKLRPLHEEQEALPLYGLVFAALDAAEEGSPLEPGPGS